MSELEDILEKKQEKKEKIGRFKVHSEHVAEIMEFARKHGIEVEKALYSADRVWYEPPSAFSSGLSIVRRYYLIRPYLYLLKTKYGQIEITYECGWYGEDESAKVKYLCSTPEEEEEIKKLFHEEKKLKS